MKLRVLLCLFSIVIVAGTSCAQPDSLWSFIWGGAESDAIRGIYEHPDGSVYVAGYTYSYGAGGCDFWFAKINSDGTQAWTRTYGGEQGEWCIELQPAPDGGFLLAGSTGSFGSVGDDYWLLKVDANGDSLWSQLYGDEHDNGCYALTLAADGGCIMAGFIEDGPAGWDDFEVVRTDAAGAELWTAYFGGEGQDRCWDVLERENGDIILCGYTGSYGSGGDGWLLAISAEGDSLWSRTFGGVEHDDCKRVIETSDGGFLLSLASVSFGPGNYDYWLVKTDANGDIEWHQTYGGADIEIPYAVREVPDGGFVVTGFSQTFGHGGNRDIWLLRTDADGDSLWSRTFGGPAVDQSTEVELTSDFGYFIGGSHDPSQSTGADCWLIKTGPDPLLDAVEPGRAIPVSYSLSLYPNPFNPSTTISFDLPQQSRVSLSVYDLLGREISLLMNRTAQAGSHSVNWNCASCATGVYFIELKTGKHRALTKAMLLR